MRIECTTGPVVTEVMGTVYRFDNDEEGRFVAEVFNPKHQACFLAVADHYRDLDAPEPGEPGAILTLTSIEPATAELGGADFTLHCFGTGFTPESVIYFADQPEPIVFLSSEEVTTIVKPSLGWGAVTLPVRVDDTPSLDFTFTEPVTEEARLIPVTEITGIGKAMETRLFEAGITDARQIAALSDDEAQQLDDHLGLAGRILRDRWVEQAKALAG